MKLVCFPSVILPHLHKQIQQLQQQQQQQRPQQQHHPLYRIVSASTEDLKKDDFRKSLTNLQGNQMLTMATDGNSRIGVVGDEMGVDIGKEGGGDKKGQKKRKRKREEDEIEWEIEKVLQWKGKKKEYGFIWEGARYRNVLYFYTREDLQQALEKVVEFWSCVCKDCWHECRNKKLVSEIESQEEKVEEEGRKIIEKIEEEKWRIVDQAICPIAEKKKQRRQTRSCVGMKKVIFYQIEYEGKEEKRWIREENIEKKNKILDYWEDQYANQNISLQK